MLTYETKKFKFQKQARTISKMSLVVNGYLYVTSFQELVHISKEGKFLWQKQYVSSNSTFGLLSQQEVVVMSVSEGTFEIVDLLTYTIRSYPHSYAFEDASPMDIFGFPDSKLFAIVEKRDFSDSILSITYYSYQNQDIKKVAVFKSQGDAQFQPMELWHAEMCFEKMNRHSKFAWWRPVLKETIDFFTFDLQSDPAGKFRFISVQNKLIKDYGIKNLSIWIDKMWEIESDVYMLVCGTNRPETDKNQSVNNKYILDVRKETIRETKFTFPGIWNAMLSSCYNLGEISVFHTYDCDLLDMGLPLPSPIYYVHNLKEEIIATEIWIATGRVGFYIPEFKTSTIIEIQHAAKDVSEVEIRTKQYFLYNLNEIYLHFMLQINEDFDDDLLYDAIRLLTDIE